MNTNDDNGRNLRQHKAADAMAARLSSLSSESRDPERIESITAKIVDLWKRYPDLRLMQLLLNSGANYYTEDDDLMIMLHNIYSKNQHESS